MAVRTITVEYDDDEYDDLEREIEDLKEQVSDLENEKDELENQLADFRESWDSVDALLTRIGEI